MAARFHPWQYARPARIFHVADVCMCQLVDLEVAPPSHELFRLFCVFLGQS